MRISDWSSDVCSSDLIQSIRLNKCLGFLGRRHTVYVLINAVEHAGVNIRQPGHEPVYGKRQHALGGRGTLYFAVQTGEPVVAEGCFGLKHLEARSEEHTSELQSLMRISYAVFCLKKKKK